MIRWRRVKNRWNLRARPWSEAEGIEEDDESVMVPALVCWFLRGTNPSDIEAVIQAHNEALK